MVSGLLQTHDSRIWTQHAPAVNTPAVVTLPATTNRSYTVSQIVLSYSGVPTGGLLTITDGTNTISVQVISGDAKSLYLPREFSGVASAAVTITLAAGGSGVTGILNVQYI